MKGDTAFPQFDPEMQCPDCPFSRLLISPARTSGRRAIRVGRLSNKGLVVAIRDRVVRVAGPDGRPGFVVCDDMSSATAASRPVPA